MTAKTKTIKIIIFILCGIFSFITVFSMFQTEAYFYEYKGDDSFDEIYINSINEYINCQNENGEISFIGNKAYFSFDSIKESAKTVVLFLSSPAEQNIIGTLYFDDNNDFVERNSAFAECGKGEDKLCFVLPEGYTAVNFRIYADNSIPFEKIEFHSGVPNILKVNLFNKALAVIISVIIGLICFVLLFALDKKFNLLSNVFSYIYKRRKIILICLVSIAVSVIFGIVFSFIINKNIVLSAVALYACIMLVTILLLVCSKWIVTKPENLLLLLILIFGTAIILCSPLGYTSWDTDFHYPSSLQTSTFNNDYLTLSDISFTENAQVSVPADNVNANKAKITFANANDKISVCKNHDGFSLPHIPAGIFIALARFFGANFYQRFVIGKFANLFFYAIVFFFAAKKLKSGKIILSVFALLPTNIYLASNYSYDYFVTSLITLGICSFVGELQTPDNPVTPKSSLAMCLPIGIGSIPKLIYMPLLALPYFVQKSKGNFGNKKKHYVICTASVIAFALLFYIRSKYLIDVGGDMRGGATVSTTGQIAYIFSNPLEFTGTLIKFVLSCFTPLKMRENLTDLYSCGAVYGSTLVLIMFIAAIFTDKNKYDTLNSFKQNLLLKTVAMVLFIGLYTLIAIAFYIDFTPVGETVIKGCQMRYMTPLIIAPALLLGNGKHTKVFSKINRTIYNYIFIIFMCVFDCCTVVKVIL